MVEIELVSRECDGAAWFNEGRICINLRWLNLVEEAEWYIDEAFMHEYVEHVLGLGHDAAVYVEKVLRRILYRDWYGSDPLLLFYGAGASTASSQPGRGAPRLRGAQPRGVPVPPL